MAQSGVPLWLEKSFPGLKSVVRLPASGQKHVYFAEEDGVQVVLKTFKAEGHDQRSIREIETACAIRCRRVPKFLAHGHLDLDGGRLLWMKEQRLPGESLRARLQRGVIETVLASIVCDHVLEALEVAEQMHVVHRDVKPENIIVCEATKSAWLIDFGIARSLDQESLTATANPFGPCTLGYASPEQIHNRKAEIDSRSDLFSLAITLYESLEGHNPLLAGATGPLEIADRTQNQPVPRPSRAMNCQFADLIEAMSRARRDHRPNTVREARDWLGDAMRRDNS